LNQTKREPTLQIAHSSLSNKDSFASPPNKKTKGENA
jgi:hypothetical protein